ncbi:MAG TPA: DUF4142 domain-containing protein [Thermoanaerobaculia bacterium]
MIACTLVVFAFACKKERSENTSTDTAATTTYASSSDTSGTTSTNPPTSLSEAEQKFMEKAAFGGMAEVSLGQQVSPKAKNADVKSFADKMVTDHSKAGDELKDLAKKKSVTLPNDLDPKDKDAAQKVMAAKNLDKTYMEDMVKDHDKDVKEFENESKAATDPDLKAWIDKTLPVLKEHQKMAHDINSKLK